VFKDYNTTLNEKKGKTGKRTDKEDARNETTRKFEPTKGSEGPRRETHSKQEKKEWGENVGVENLKKTY